MSVGDVLDIAHILKRAVDLYKSCASAPEEIYLARDHIHQMRLCLEGVDSDIIKNPSSFVHQSTAIAKSQAQELKKHVGSCKRALKRSEGLLKKYCGFKSKHVSLWDRFRWSTEGKKEIGECKSDLVFATSLLDMFLQRVGLSVLWKIESLLEAFFRQMGAPQLANLVNLPATGPRQSRPRAGSNVTRTIVISLFLAKLRKALRTYRKKKQQNSSGKKPHPSPKKPKPATRVNSGFKPSKKRNDMIKDYASNLANASTPPPLYSPRKGRPRTPSPDFHYVPGGCAVSPTPRPIRRASSMQRLMGRINAPVKKPAAFTEHYECWKVGVGNLAIGLKTAPVFFQHKRGQMQLRRIAAVFKEAATYDAKALAERDSRVKLILNERNKGEKKKNGGKGSGKKWYFISGRVIRRDPGKTGVVSVEKAMVVLVRR